MTIDSIGVNDIYNLYDKNSLPKRQKIETQGDETYFQTILKSACIGQHFIHEPSPFEAKHRESLECDVDVSYENQIPLELGRRFMPNVDAAVDLSLQPIGISTTPVVDQEPALNPSIDQFVKSIWPYARQAAALIGLDPKILMAQVALETGWGRFIAKDVDGSSSHNLFNIKAHNADESVQIKTTEYEDNMPIKITASFKKYVTAEHSFNDYIALIKGDSRYKNALSNVSDPNRYVNALYDAGYATDPGYAGKILSIYHGDELQQALDRTGCLV